MNNTRSMQYILLKSALTDTVNAIYRIAEHNKYLDSKLIMFYLLDNKYAIEIAKGMIDLNNRDLVVLKQTHDRLLKQLKSLQVQSNLEVPKRAMSATDILEEMTKQYLDERKYLSRHTKGTYLYREEKKETKGKPSHL